MLQSTDIERLKKRGAEGDTGISLDRGNVGGLGASWDGNMNVVWEWDGLISEIEKCISESSRNLVQWKHSRLYKDDSS